MRLPGDDREGDDGWGGEDEGTRRIDDCIDELSFGGDEDDDDERWGSL